jgi:O-Antigen ligase
VRVGATADAVVAAVTIAGTFALWSATDAGYEEILWYPVALILLVLATVLAFSAPQRRLGGWTIAALGGLAAYVAWAYLSIAWAGDRGIALTGANRALLYLIVFFVCARRRWRGLDAFVLLLGWATITVVSGSVALGRAADAADPLGSFFGGRMSSPVNYANANAALFLLAAFPLAFASLERRFPWPVRAAALGLATVATELAVLSQSKGAALGTAVTLVVVAAVVRAPARTLVPPFAVGCIVAAFSVPLLHVYTVLGATPAPGSHHAVVDASLAVAGSFLCAVVVGAALAAVDARATAGSIPRLRGAGVAFLGLWVLGAVTAVLVVVAHFGGPAATVEHGWHSFKTPPLTDPQSHFTSTAGNHRYDLWRVAAQQFRRSPIGGAGIDNFGAQYVRDRRTDEQPLYPHSLEARLLGGTGIVGFLLFGVFAAAALRLAAGAARSRTAFAPAGAAALAMFTYWLAHGSVDWLWEFPGLTGPAFAALGCITALEAPSARKLGRRGRRLLTGAGVAAAAVSALLLAPAWIAARDVATALSTWHTDPVRAYSELRQATRFNRLSDDAYVVAGTIAEHQGAWASVEDDFRAAIDRNPSNWYSHLELGVALANRGSAGAARAQLEQAHVLDPREELVDQALSEVKRHKRVNATVLDSEIIARTPGAAAN